MAIDRNRKLERSSKAAGESRNALTKAVLNRKNREINVKSQTDFGVANIRAGSNERIQGMQGRSVLAKQRLVNKGGMAEQTLRGGQGMERSVFESGAEDVRRKADRGLESQKIGLEGQKIDLQGKRDAASSKYQQGVLANQQETLAQKIRRDSENRFSSFAEMDEDQRSAYQRGPGYRDYMQSEFDNAYTLMSQEPNEERKAATWQALPAEIRNMFEGDYEEIYGE